MTGDRDAVAALLGRAPQADFEVVVRGEDGRPIVIRNEPLLDDGTPMPDLLGPGKTAEMTYYETAAGAKVFDAGAINFASTATTAPVSTLLENLWARLSVP